MLTADDMYEIIGSAAGLGIALLVLAGLALRLRESATPRLHLWAMVGFFLVDLLDMAEDLVYRPVFAANPAFYAWDTVFYPLFLVCLWLFVRGLTTPGARLHRSDIRHLLAPGGALLIALPFLSLPGAVRLDPGTADVSPERLLLAELSVTGFWIWWMLLVAFYGTFCVRRLVQHRRNVRELFSELDRRELVWLDVLVLTILTLAGVVVLDEAITLAGLPAIRQGFGAMVFDMCLAGSLGLFALRVEPPLPDWSAPVVDPPTDDTPPDTAKPERYARSGLTPDDLQRLAARVEARMAEGRLWREHDLTLRGLAEAAALTPIHLSEVLNAGLDMTFYDYVNRHRIEDACALLRETEMTVLEIAETVGFNAKSTFNARFKQVTGQTPSAWRNAHPA